MSKKIIILFIGIIFFSSFGLAKAEVVINEIAWKGTPTNSNEWLELANTGASVDISGWTIKDGETPAQLNITIPTGTTIINGGFYVVKRNNSDVTPYDLSVAFSGGLKDAGEKLILADSTGTPKQTLDFSGGWPDPGMTSENTMQWDGSSWISSTPTSGAENQTTNSAPSNDSDNSDSGSSDDSVGGGSSSGSSSSSPSKPKVIPNPTMQLNIIANKLAFAGQPFEMQTNVFGLVNEKVVLGRAYWSFGDGSSLEQINNFEKFSHTYYYPGDYVVFLEYYKDSFTESPEISKTMKIKVIPTTVVISKVGDVRDFFVELSNNASSDIDVSNWIINANGKFFVLPKHTMIISQKQMTISGKITGFVYGDQYNLRLLSSTGDLIHVYGTPVNTSSKKVVQSKSSNSSNVSVSEKVIPVDESKKFPINLEATSYLGGQSLAINSNDDSIENSSNSNSYFPTVASFVFIGFSAGVVYFLRSKKVVPKAGDDFDILDE